MAPLESSREAHHGPLTGSHMSIEYFKKKKIKNETGMAKPIRNIRLLLLHLLLRLLRPRYYNRPKSIRRRREQDLFCFLPICWISLGLLLLYAAAPTETEMP